MSICANVTYELGEGYHVAEDARETRETGARTLARPSTDRHAPRRPVRHLSRRLVRPQVGFAAVKLLEEAGCEVEVPPAQTCCGQPAWNSGADRDAAGDRPAGDRGVREVSIIWSPRRAPARHDRAALSRDVSRTTRLSNRAPAHSPKRPMSSCVSRESTRRDISGGKLVRHGPVITIPVLPCARFG